MEKLFILIILMFFAGCSTTSLLITNQSMLPDGNTWGNGKDCNEFIKEQLMSRIKLRGKDLCGIEPNRIFSCSDTLKRKFAKLSCYVECKGR